MSLTAWAQPCRPVRGLEAHFRGHCCPRLDERLDDGAALEHRRAAPAGGDREPLDASPDHRRLGGLRATIGTASAYAARLLRHKGRRRNRPTPASRTPEGTAGSPPTPLMLPSASSPLSLLMPLRAGQPYTHDGASGKRESSRLSRLPGASGARFSSQGRSRRGRVRCPAQGTARASRNLFGPVSWLAWEVEETQRRDIDLPRAEFRRDGEGSPVRGLPEADDVALRVGEVREGQRFGDDGDEGDRPAARPLDAIEVRCDRRPRCMGSRPGMLAASSRRGRRKSRRATELREVISNQVTGLPVGAPTPSLSNCWSYSRWDSPRRWRR